jgi:CheY-like chemotaxis protein
MPKKVLLIEYEPRYVDRIRTLIAPLGHTLTEAHDGEAGLQAFGNSRFDLVLLSGMLPRLPSAEVIREVRKKGGATAPPIILMMSGYRGTNRKADAQKVGAYDILVRPFSDEDLVASVREALESSDVGAKTMRIDASQLAAAGAALTSSDIFSDVLDDLVEPASKARRPPPRPLAASGAGRHPPPVPPKPRKAQDDMDQRLRDTLSGLMPQRSRRRRSPPPRSRRRRLPSTSRARAASAAKPKLSSDTDVDRILSDTLSGISLPKSRPRRAPRRARLRRRRARPACRAPRRRRRRARSPRPRSPHRARTVRAVRDPRADRGGGMAELYKAKRTGVEGFQKIVAIKKILPHLADDEAFVTMFADEAKLAAQLNHPNIIHIYDLGRSRPAATSSRWSTSTAATCARSRRRRASSGCRSPSRSRSTSRRRSRRRSTTRTAAATPRATT